MRARCYCDERSSAVDVESGGSGVGGRASGDDKDSCSKLQIEREGGRRRRIEGADATVPPPYRGEGTLDKGQGSTEEVQNTSAG